MARNDIGATGTSKQNVDLTPGDETTGSSRLNVPHNESHNSARDRLDEHRTIVKPAKTSAAAVFSLVFGLSALLSVLTVLLAPLAIILAIIGIILGIVGMKMAKRVGVTGKGVAIGGLALSVIAILLAATAAIGITTFLNNDAAVNRLDKQVQKLRDNLPAKVEVPKAS